MPSGKYVRTAEIRQKIGAAHLGIPAHQNQKMAVSIQNSAPKTEEHKRKISEGCKQYYEKKRVETGSAFTKEHSQKISDTKQEIKQYKEEINLRQKLLEQVKIQKSKGLLTDELRQEILND